MDYKFRNITISGLPGTGSTTLLKSLAKRLPDWTPFSGGEFMRAYALEKKIFKPNMGLHHDARHYEDDFDRKIDFGMREALQTKEKQILESWLSGFMAQDIPGVLKVLLNCDESLRVDRIVNRDEISVQEAKQNIFERENSNRNKWIRLYADQWKEWVVDKQIAGEDEPIDFWNPKLYDVIIDTYSKSKEETLTAVMDAVKFGINH
jgi:cytidylate kinase